MLDDQSGACDNYLGEAIFKESISPRQGEQIQQYMTRAYYAISMQFRNLNNMHKSMGSMATRGTRGMHCATYYYGARSLTRGNMAPAAQPYPEHCYQPPVQNG